MPLPGFITLGNDPVPIVRENVLVPCPVWTGAVNLASTGIGSMDRRTRSELLCGLRSIIFQYFLVLPSLIER